jgi:hypothetical protein
MLRALLGLTSLLLAIGCSSDESNGGGSAGAGAGAGAGDCQSMKCTADTRCSYIGGVAGCLTPCPDAGSCAGGQSCGCASSCPNCKNCVSVCLPGNGGCTGPSPAGCTVNPCPSGMVCDTTISCVSSSCTCTADGWACTNDCGGGECVPKVSDGGAD